MYKTQAMQEHKHQRKIPYTLPLKVNHLNVSINIFKDLSLQVSPQTWLHLRTLRDSLKCFEKYDMKQDLFQIPD